MQPAFPLITLCNHEYVYRCSLNFHPNDEPIPSMTGETVSDLSYADALWKAANVLRLIAK